MKTIFNLILIFGLAAFGAHAQDAVSPPMSTYQPLSGAQLNQLLGPVALYPDPLMAVLLPASTFPTEIVLADRYVSNGGDPNQIDQQPWDQSVQALAHYPDVLKWMDDNLNWTTQLGQAFINQQQDVMNAVQQLRSDAYNLGNLQSTPQQQVVDDNGYIEILPANPDNLYVPDYQPSQVYYQAPSGPPFIVFTTGYLIGPWLCCDFDWNNHNVVYWTAGYPRPANWWRYRPAQRTAYLANHTTIWNAANRPGYQGYQGDRGWNNQGDRGWNPPAVNRPAPILSGHPTPTFGEHDMNDQRPSDNAFIGIQSAHDTRDFSNRGQESTGADNHSSGGGGFHGGGNQPPSGGGAPPSGGGGGRR
jgi:hypothetical protein